MQRILFGIVAFGIGVLLISSPVVSQPPEGKGGKDGKEGKDGKGGPPRFELGKAFPPPLLEQLNLTPAQEKELEAIEKDLKVKLDKLLTADQKQIAADFRPRGPGGMGEKSGKGGMGEKGGKGGKGAKGDKGDKGDKGERPDRPPVE
jgi:hypothetical protein